MICLLDACNWHMILVGPFLPKQSFLGILEFFSFFLVEGSATTIRAGFIALALCMGFSKLPPLAIISFSVCPDGKCSQLSFFS